ncbi:MAG: NifB/NifX family molybdenum-iron cluster-binding protein [Candidatus Hodarchaeota archaeon]
MTETNVEELPKRIELRPNVMKICLPSNGIDLSTSLASSFERCSYFVTVDSDQQETFTTFLNDAQTAARGASIQAAQLLIDQQVELVITPQIDSIALNILQRAGIKTYLGVDDTIQENINLVLQGRLVEIRIVKDSSNTND